jgi:hypothetical protein
MKKIIYVVRTDMLLLKILMILFGYVNWKVALRKEIYTLPIDIFSGLLIIIIDIVYNVCVIFLP